MASSEKQCPPCRYRCLLLDPSKAVSFPGWASPSATAKCSNPWPFLWHFAELPLADHYLPCYWCSPSWTECLDVVSGGWVEGNNHSPVYCLCSLTIALDILAQGHTLRAHVHLTAGKITSSPGEQRDCFKVLFLPGAGLYICPCWILYGWLLLPANFGSLQVAALHQVVLLAWCHLTPNERVLHCLLQVSDRSS